MPENKMTLPDPLHTIYLKRRAEYAHASPDTVRELMGIFYRNKRIIRITFLATLAGAVLAIALFGIKYESDMKILVKHRRVDDVVSTDGSSREQTSSTDVPTEREINTEISLLHSQDLLAAVVTNIGLDKRQDHYWNSLLPWRDEQWKIAAATRKLREGLKIVEIPQSNMIQVSYRSSHPELAAQILSEVKNQYMAKHLAVYRPPGVFDFFHGQAQHYQKELDQAENQLAGYDLQKNSTDPDLEKEILVRKAGEFEGSLQETRSAMAETEKQIQELQAQLSKTPDRLTAQVTSGDNPQLLANLKSSLQQLETQRTDLLTKYKPTYRLVEEVDKQIADQKAAIAAESQNPVKQVTDNQNPTYLVLQTELVKANTAMKGYIAKARATAPVVSAYKQQALIVDQKGIQRADILRNIKSAEENYTLYLQKQEQARISDELDKNRILNVAFAESPMVPSVPVYSPLLLIVSGIVMALMLSIAAGFFSDYLDPSIRTPEELDAALNLPMLACFAKNDTPPRYALAGGTGMHYDRQLRSEGWRESLAPRME